MPKMHEIACFHKNLTLKMYLEFDIFPCWLHFSLHFFTGPHPPISKIISPRIWTYLKNDIKTL